jgi:L-arabinose isomerase
MKDLDHLEAWLVTGSQDLYGSEALKKVQIHADAIARELGLSTEIPVRIVAKPVMTNSEAIHRLCLDANSSADCVALIAWMHTFSPARMWIRGLQSLEKPLLHFHT